MRIPNKFSGYRFDGTRNLHDPVTLTALTAAGAGTGTMAGTALLGTGAAAAAAPIATAATAAPALASTLPGILPEATGILPEALGGAQGIMQGAAPAAVETTAGITSANSPALSIVVYEGYDENSNRGDLALIKVNDIFGGAYSNLASDLEVADAETLFSQATAVGFGRVSQNGPTSVVGLEVSMRLWSQAECRKQWPYRGATIFSGFICSQGSTAATV
jgi:hypothetical protein